MAAALWARGAALWWLAALRGRSRIWAAMVSAQRSRGTVRPGRVGPLGWTRAAAFADPHLPGAWSGTSVSSAMPCPVSLGVKISP
jgi:hypothetical protein